MQEKTMKIMKKFTRFILKASKKNYVKVENFYSGKSTQLFPPQDGAETPRLYQFSLKTPCF
jgi:hypothetical protein